MFTKQMQQKIKLWLAENPLQDDELHKVEGMGELYVSLDMDHAQDNQFLYTLEIAGTEFHFFSGSVANGAAD